MKKSTILVVMVLCMLGLGGCSDNALKGDSECVVSVEDMPKELSMLDENILEQFYIKLTMENIYTEEEIDVRLNAENDFRVELNLIPGTYRIVSCYNYSSRLVPMELEAVQEKVELTKDGKGTVDIRITNREAFSDWAWNCEASREILQADAFSRKIQLDGQVMELEQVKDYVTFEYDEKVAGFEKVTLSNGEKGITVVLQNTQEEAAGWQDCKLVEIHFTKNNVIWGQGAHVGMDVTQAIHATDGLYGKPDDMSGTILAGVGYDHTYVSWLNEDNGDKLSLELEPDGDYISEIIYYPGIYE